MSWLIGGSEFTFGIVLLVAVLITLVILRPRDGREVAILQPPGATVVITLLLVVLIAISIGLVTRGLNTLL